EKVGTTRQTILSIEKGRYTPSVGLALRISQILGAAVEELFKLKEDWNDS
ncbi:helix-turn-helix domain-containing protein, partial [bacterium]|nr:helix-turn-helix domain-containing protein [bacterium]